MSTQSLPRVTYSNINADFTPVHALLDELIPQVKAAVLGRYWPHRIGGRDVAVGPSYEAHSPIDDRLLLGSFHRASTATVDEAVAWARTTQRGWAALPWRDRLTAVRRFADQLEADKFVLAAACLLEVGKSRLEAVGEAEEAIDLVRYYADQMEEHQGFSRSMKRAFETERTSDHLKPFGAFGVIAPFNFPLALSVGMISAALIAGNAVVYKPSEFAGLTGALIMQAADKAGLPAGLLNLICGNGETGQAMIDHPGFDGFAFTGSYQVGTAILRAVAQGRFNRPLVIEMGGKNPTYVAASADVARAASGLVRSAFGLQGQKCSSGSKVYVHASLKDALMAQVVDLTRAIQIGDPTDKSVFMGPLVNEAAFRRFEAACAHAARDGRIITGGKRMTGGLFDHGFYVEPTIVDGLPPDHALHKQELFLPFLTVQNFADLREAIADGNAVAYGLTAGCYARDQLEIDLFLDRAEAGALYVNRASGATTGAWPGIQTFCGWKGSGVSGKGGLGPYYIQQFMREQSHTIWVD
ncbi:1-pyrroline-5-carboxylate dehydrogenase [Hyphomicrobiales bacterium]|nr:1-pyrroline-5-carboxylate dehydrogenase [Hyphomicrobiales bacterium]CAH1690776.1 1-pyrroline-5-carboxylate dehydrogenase [Hyphomicrobiales bacterium]